MKMTETFKTFKPQDPIVARYVDYYYLDIKPENAIREFECFPHFNNTISFYRSHRMTSDRNIQYEKDGGFLQIFTPIRENVLYVKQTGMIHRVSIVFNPLGIQQFYPHLATDREITDFEFFTTSETNRLFTTDDTSALCSLLDEYLSSRYQEYRNEIVSQALQHLFENSEALSMEELAKKLEISRRHLTRIFTLHFGVSAQKFQKIVLFRKVLNHKLFDQKHDSFTSVAHEHNFSDQAHFNKMFGQFTHHSPKQFLKKGTLLGTEDTFWHLLE